MSDILCPVVSAARGEKLVGAVPLKRVPGRRIPWWGYLKTTHSRKPLSVRLEYTRNCVVAQVCIEWYPARVCI